MSKHGNMKTCSKASSKASNAKNRRELVKNVKKRVLFSHGPEGRTQRGMPTLEKRKEVLVHKV